MASELYYTPEDKLATEGAGGKVNNNGVSGKRSFINRSFHNEIIGEDEKTLNKAKVNMCCRALSCMTCCCKANRSERIFRKARIYNEQELNITSIIKAQREAMAACNLLRDSMSGEAETAINTAVKRVVSLSDDELDISHKMIDGFWGSYHDVMPPMDEEAQGKNLLDAQDMTAQNAEAGDGTDQPFDAEAAEQDSANVEVEEEDEEALPKSKKTKGKKRQNEDDDDEP